jgi:hypothetical protein
MAKMALGRHAGQIALAAGTALAVLDLARWVLERDDVIGMMADPVFRVANGAYFLAFVGLAIALFALHEHLAAHYGRYGLIAFLVAFVGTMTQGGNMWFDGFAAPWLAEVAPQVFAAEKTITLQVGALAAYLFFALGWMMFGIALLRAHVGPAVSVAVIVGGLLGFRSGLPPFGIPLGLAVAALGVVLIRSAAQRPMRQLPRV